MGLKSVCRVSFCPTGSKKFSQRLARAFDLKDFKFQLGDKRVQWSSLGMTETQRDLHRRTGTQKWFTEPQWGSNEFIEAHWTFGHTRVQAHGDSKNFQILDTNFIIGPTLT